MLRLVNYFSFMFSAFIIGLFLRRPDLIFISSPPLFAGPAAVWLSLIKRTPLALDARDIWPEEAIMMGELKNRFAIFGGRLTAQLLYRNSRLIIAPTEGLNVRLKNMAPGKEVITVFNGSSFPDINPTYVRVYRRQHEEMTVCYSGVLGLHKPIEDIINAAEATADDQEISYLIVGEGVRRISLLMKVAEKGLHNIHFTGGVSIEKAFEYMMQSDVGISPLVVTEIFKGAIPAKMFDYMALGLPIISGVDGEARELLERNETGLFYRSGDWQDLRDKILFLKNNPDEARRLGENGRKLVSEKFRRSQQALQLEAILSGRFGKKTG